MDMEEFPSTRKKLRLRGAPTSYVAEEISSDEPLETEVVGPDNMANVIPATTEATQSTTAASGGGTSGTRDLASLLQAGGAVNPYIGGAGMALAVLAAKAERKQRQKELEYQAKQNQLERQQVAISRLIGISANLRQL